MRTVVLFRGQSGRGVKLTIHLHLVPRLQGSALYFNFHYMRSLRGEGQIYLSPKGIFFRPTSMISRNQYNFAKRTNYKVPNFSVFSIVLTYDQKDWGAPPIITRKNTVRVELFYPTARADGLGQLQASTRKSKRQEHVKKYSDIDKARNKKTRIKLQITTQEEQEH